MYQKRRNLELSQFEHTRVSVVSFMDDQRVRHAGRVITYQLPSGTPTEMAGGIRLHVADEPPGPQFIAPPRFIVTALCLLSSELDARHQCRRLEPVHQSSHSMTAFLPLRIAHVSLDIAQWYGGHHSTGMYNDISSTSFRWNKITRLALLLKVRASSSSVSTLSLITPSIYGPRLARRVAYQS